MSGVSCEECEAVLARLATLEERVDALTAAITSDGK